MGGLIGVAGTLGVEWLRRDQDTRSRREIRAFARADDQRKVLTDLQDTTDLAMKAVVDPIRSFKSKPLPPHIDAIERDALDLLRRMSLVAARSGDASISQLSRDLMVAALEAINTARTSRQNTPKSVIEPVQIPLQLLNDRIAMAFRQLN